MSKLIITRVAAIFVSMLIVAVCFVRGNSQIPFPVGPEKTQIVESLLQLEKKTQDAQFENFRKLSSENIGTLSAGQISKLGFSLLSVEEINRLKIDHVIEYLRIKSINYLGDGRVVVKLLRVSEGRPCFSAPFSRQQLFTYEFTRNVDDGSGRWIGRLKPSLPFSVTSTTKQ